MSRAFLCLGGNIGDPRASFSEALALLAQRGVRLIRASRLYRTPPWGPVPQADYLNQVVEIEIDDDPRTLLGMALETERRLGRDRTRETRYGPRAIDIDLLIYEGTTLEDDDLILPHPRLHERAFALVPLVEIAPQVLIRGIPAKDWLEGLDVSNIAPEE